MSNPHDAMDSLDELEPLPKRPMFTAGFRAKAVRLRWLLHVTFIGLGVAILVAAFLMQDSVYWAVALPLVVLLVLTIILEVCGWRQTRFCPHCDALLYSPLLQRTKLGFCESCDSLVDSGRVLLEPPGEFDLGNPLLHHHQEPTIRFLAMVLLIAIKDRASEVRFEPGRNQNYRLSFLCGGALYEMIPPPSFLHRRISETLKALAGLTTDTRPQKGKLRIKVGHDPSVSLKDYDVSAMPQTILPQQVDAVVETQPGEVGENVVVSFALELNGYELPAEMVPSVS